MIICILCSSLNDEASWWSLTWEFVELIKATEEGTGESLVELFCGFRKSTEEVVVLISESKGTSDIVYDGRWLETAEAALRKSKSDKVRGGNWWVTAVGSLLVEVPLVDDSNAWFAASILSVWLMEKMKKRWSVNKYCEFGDVKSKQK